MGQFDLITLDADKPMHKEYYESSLRLLRPGGILIMFGMMMQLTTEDQEAMQEFHDNLPNDTRIATAQLPVGCGLQVIVKRQGRRYDHALTRGTNERHKLWELEAELAAIDRQLEALEHPYSDTASKVDLLDSEGVVAMQVFQRRQMQAFQEEQEVAARAAA